MTDRDFVEKVRNIVCSQLDNQKLNVDTLAAELNLSHSSLYRKLKNSTGMRIVDFMKIIRLEEAARLLLTTLLNIDEICYLTGFSDPKYFRKCFIKQYSKTPSEFRKGDSL